MPCDFILMVMESNVTVAVVGHSNLNLVVGQRCAVLNPIAGRTVAATAKLISLERL